MDKIKRLSIAAIDRDDYLLELDNYHIVRERERVDYGIQI